MTLSTIHWVPVQDKGSKILCCKLGAMKITPSDCLHQEYLTINLGSTSDCRKLKLSLVRLFIDGVADAGQQEQPGAENAGGGAVCCHLTFQCTGATSQDGSSLEFIAAIAGRQCYIQDASGRGL